MAACSMPGNTMSPTYCPRPSRRRGSSLRRRRSPTNFTPAVELLVASHAAETRVLEERDVDAPGSHALSDLAQELREDAHLVLRRAAAEAGLARDAVGIDLSMRGVAPFEGEPEVAIPAELDVLDHRDDSALDA